MYTITVHSRAEGDASKGVYSVPEYEVKDGVLTLAVDEDHDIVIPLYQVSRVDILRQK